MIIPIILCSLSREESSTDSSSGSAVDSNVVEIPTGAPPIFPASPHQISNVGETDVKIVSVEVSGGQVGETPDHLSKSPCDTDPECYKILAENDEW